MGECEVNDVELPQPAAAGNSSGSAPAAVVGRRQGVLVKRCRYLEQAGCASVCLNSCKVPTQEFFAHDMGLALDITPNYEDFSCQFSFGRPPPPESADPAFATPCFTQCPTAAAAALPRGRDSPQQQQQRLEAARCHNVKPNAP